MREAGLHDAIRTYAEIAAAGLASGAGAAALAGAATARSLGNASIAVILSGSNISVDSCGVCSKASRPRTAEVSCASS